MKSKVKKQSILKRIFIPMLGVMIIQSTVIYGMLFMVGTFNVLEENAYDLLHEKTSSRQDRFQSDMIERWSNVSDAMLAVNDKAEKYLVENTATDEAITSSSHAFNDEADAIALLKESAEEIIYLLRRNSVTGAYLILNGDDNNNKKRGVYFRDSDPMSNPPNYSDILAERAPAVITQELEIATNSFWQPDFSLDESNKDKTGFFYKPLRAAINYPDIAADELGYWGKPFYLNGEGKRDSARVITYSVPLVLKDGTVYGVLGIEINENYLAKQLPARELNRDSGAGYIVMVSAKDEKSEDLQEIYPIASSGSYINRLYEYGDVLGLMRLNDRDDTYILGNLRTDDTVYCAKQDLNLYNSHTPFENDQWALLGVESEEALLGFNNDFKMMMLIAVFVSLGVGILGIILVSRMIAMPIGALAAQVKTLDPNAPIELEKLGIEEIDELSDSIEVMSVNVADANRKLTEILEMAESSIAVFEYHDRNRNQVVYTRQFAQLLMLPDDSSQSLKIRDFLAKVRMYTPKKEAYYEETRESIYKLSINDKDYWLKLEVAKEERLTGVITDVTREVLDKKRLEYDRDFDVLTDLYNRRAFHTKMFEFFENPEDLGTAAVIMLDLDNLKSVNDTYGHDFGDKYIRQTADVLKKYSTENSLVARLSGDEFIAFLYGFEGKDTIRKICEAIKLDMNHTILSFPDGSDMQIEISAGIAWYPDDSESYEELIRYADFAMYTVKKTNKGQFKEFDFSFYNKHSYLLYSKKELDQIIERRLIAYQFQPIIDSKTGDIFAYEALMRPQGETIKDPTALLSLARAHTRLAIIEEMTFFMSLEAYEKLDAPKQQKKIFINSIGNQMLTEELILQLEEKHGEDINKIVIEVTEEDQPEAEVMDKKKALLKRWKGEFALDDFGSGYSSEGAMLTYSPDYIKIDMSIIRNIHEDINRQTLIQNLIRYARHDDIKLIAEGVELREEMEYLICAGVDYLQGYYLSKPLSDPPESLPANLLRDIAEINKYKLRAVMLEEDE